MMPVLSRLLRYGVVGGTAAAVHIGVLLMLGPWMNLSLANPIAFLTASVAGYLGHALLTFREETGGRQFARRWLLLQYVVNISVCALLPLLHAPTLVLVFTPTVLNALIWSRAAARLQIRAFSTVGVNTSTRVGAWSSGSRAQTLMLTTYCSSSQRRANWRPPVSSRKVSSAWPR